MNKESVSTWWKLNPKLLDHETSSSHILAFKNWKEFEIRIKSESTIDKIEQDEIKSETKKWREILTRLLDIIRFLAKQNLAFRGHREELRSCHNDEINNKGNFLE